MGFVVHHAPYPHYVDVRDAEQARLRGLVAEGLGFEVFNVTAADTLSEVPTEELIRRHTALA